VYWFHRGLSLRIERSFPFALFIVSASLGPRTMPELVLFAVGAATVVAVRELAQAAVLAGFRPRILLSATGGETAALKPVPALRAVVAALAGPAALAVLAWLAPPPLAMLARAWALVSLLPLYPLPLGRVLPRMHVAAAVLALALALMTFPHAPLVLIFAVIFVVNVGRMLGRPLSIDPVRDNLRDGVEALQRNLPHVALDHLRDAFDAAPSDRTAAWLASALLLLGRLDEATQLLDDPVAGPEAFRQLMAALFYAARYPEAARVGERSWAMKEDPLTAFNLACTWARLAQPETALGWLSRALDAGWRDLHGLDDDPDLAPLRVRPEWAPLRARLTSLGARA
jgi:hypothetical protein